jgi:hypothetical protein
MGFKFETLHADTHDLPLPLCTTHDDIWTTLYSAFEHSRIYSTNNHIIEITSESSAFAYVNQTIDIVLVLTKANARLKSRLYKPYHLFAHTIGGA